MAPELARLFHKFLLLEVTVRVVEYLSSLGGRVFGWSHVAMTEIGVLNDKWWEQMMEWYWDLGLTE